MIFIAQYGEYGWFGNTIFFYPNLTSPPVGSSWHSEHGEKCIIRINTLQVT